MSSSTSGLSVDFSPEVELPVPGADGMVIEAFAYEPLFGLELLETEPEVFEAEPEGRLVAEPSDGEHEKLLEGSLKTKPEGEAEPLFVEKSIW